MNGLEIGFPMWVWFLLILKGVLGSLGLFKGGGGVALDPAPFVRKEGLGPRLGE